MKKLSRMNIKPLASLVLLTSATAFAIGEAEQSQKQLQVFPKNLARQHLGSNLFLFNATSQKFQPTEAAAAWLDDDVTTGWPVMAGPQHYLVTLAEPTLVTNLALSTRPTAGTVTVYVGDEPAAPGAKSWTAVAKGIPVNSISEKKLGQPFSRFAKYLLIETDMADPGPLFSLYVYGDRPAVNYQLRKRDTPIDPSAIFGPYVNNATTYSVSALYAHSTITHAAGGGSYLSWQRAIDENPESGVSVMPTTDEAGLVLKLSAGHQLSRFAVLTGGAPAKGKLEFFVVPNAPQTTSAAPDGEAGIAKVNNPAAAPAIVGASLAGLTATTTLVLDGSATRGAIAFPGVSGSAVLVRWTPDTAGQALDLRELNAFNEISLNEYELSLTPEAVAALNDSEGNGNGRSYADSGKGGGDFKDYKDGKSIPPVGEFLSPRSPFLPGSLGFPPNLTRRVLAPTPVSP
jgi:hypothetical protein